MSPAKYKKCYKCMYYVTQNKYYITCRYHATLGCKNYIGDLKIDKSDDCFICPKANKNMTFDEIIKKLSFDKPDW